MSGRTRFGGLDDSFWGLDGISGVFPGKLQKRKLADRRWPVKSDGIMVGDVVLSYHVLLDDVVLLGLGG